jgi:hypothetical protein
LDLESARLVLFQETNQAGAAVIRSAPSPMGTTFGQRPSMHAPCWIAPRERADFARLAVGGLLYAEYSTSIRSGIITATLITMTARENWGRTARTASSLLAPAVPTMRIRLLVGEIFSTVARNWKPRHRCASHDETIARLILFALPVHTICARGRLTIW